MVCKMTCKHSAIIDLTDVGGIDLIEIFNDEIIDAHQEALDDGVPFDKQETINWLLEAYADELRRSLSISVRKVLNKI